MQTLKALRPLSGKYGHVHPGAMFTCDDETAEQLEARGLAYRHRPPKVHTAPVESFIPQGYETKILPPAAEPTKRATSKK